MLSRPYIKRIVILLIALTTISYMLSFKISGDIYTFLIYEVSRYNDNNPPSVLTPQTNVKKTMKNYCNVPHMDPFDKSIIQYYLKENPLNCGNLPPLISSNNTHLIIEETSFDKYNITNPKLFSCSYRTFWRIEPTYKQVDHIVKYADPIFFNSSLLIKDEYVAVECFFQNKSIYKDYHCFVPHLQSTVEDDLIKEKLNVIVVGLDAISRLNFHRTMPLTLNYLLRKLKAIEFKGYNKVGDNTFPNLVAVLTGLKEHELKENNKGTACFKNNTDKFDDCDFIWKSFNKSGYVTAFVEDATAIGVFHYLKRGFKIQPTNYYWTTFSFQAEYVTGHNSPGNAYLCAGMKPVFKILLDYLMKFVDTYKNSNKRFFGLFWQTSLSHDYLNLPQVGDEYYLQMLKHLKESKIFEKTILIFMSDHGIRWGNIRSTHQGHMEERLPMLYVVLPSWFQDKYPLARKNIEENANKLTTPFDLHETFKDINKNNFDTDKLTSITRGISLFKTIPENRTCTTAGIDQHWCTCQSSEQLNVKDEIVSRVVNFTINHINRQLQNYSKCANISLFKIKYASFSESHDFLKNQQIITYYTVNFQTLPGNAEFESTVKCLKYNNTSDYELSGSISRTNVYGNQSQCVNEAKVKLYCYCLKM